MTRRKEILLGMVTLVVAAALWLPVLHLFFRPSGPPLAVFEQGPGSTALSPTVEKLLAGQVAMWKKPAADREAVLTMRRSNPEWDFMGRTFLVCSMANVLVRYPERTPELLPLIDRIIDDTLELEREQGPLYFLMSYGANRPFVQQPARSQFLDGEIALMMGMRQLVDQDSRYARLLQERVDTIVSRMNASPALCTESYPDECWTFCNAVALAAIKISDVVSGADHREFLANWVTVAQRDLVDDRTGLLISRFGYSDGGHWEGPEGSSIWMVAHCLEIVDESFARDQYERAKEHLAGSILGFGYSREWPRTDNGSPDVDAGLVVPVLGASAGGSGLALIGSAAFDDREYFAALMTSLDFAGFPVETNGALTYAASNQVGDATLLYALTLGPAWDRVRERSIPRELE